MEELKAQLDQLRQRLAEMRGYFDAEQRTSDLAELEIVLAAPDLWDDPNQARSIIGKANLLRAILTPFQQLCRQLDDADVLFELASEEEDESHRKNVAAEIGEALLTAEAGFDKLETQSLLSGKLDSKNAFMTLHAGAGGTESCDWADMLFRMYRRYAERAGLEFELYDITAGEEAGIKSASFLLSGPFAYGFLKNERGVHRLVRISPFDSNSRRHTSFAALDVIAEIDDEIEVEIKDEDVRIDTFRASGAGGQHVNTTDSAVRITHAPTGIVVSCQAERSQHKNRSKAMKVLKARVYDYIMDQKKKEMERFYGKKGEIAWGSQIRSYVMQPYTMVKDHRMNLETSNVASVMDGNIQAFIDANLKAEAVAATPASGKVNA
ncbi:MAG: peptide chain release factor 2 [Verrucomicrobia bacterium]|nr:peptide chain release factor 2 [Verrucomicrobiota bacterium]MDA1085524.1 peptide chain release factor 2 [Verrucomicrobiota bacterium]